MCVPPLGATISVRSRNSTVVNWGGRLYVFEAPCPCTTYLPHWGTSPSRQPRGPCMFWWPQGLSHPSAKNNNFTLNSGGSSMTFLPSGCNDLTYRAVVDSIVNLSEETLTQDLAHCDVTSGNSVFFWSQLKDMFLDPTGGVCLKMAQIEARQDGPCTRFWYSIHRLPFADWFGLLREVLATASGASGLCSWFLVESETCCKAELKLFKQKTKQLM